MKKKNVNGHNFSIMKNQEFSLRKISMIIFMDIYFQSSVFYECSRDKEIQINRRKCACQDIQDEKLTLNFQTEFWLHWKNYLEFPQTFSYLTENYS